MPFCGKRDEEAGRIELEAGWREIGGDRGKELEGELKE